MTEYERNQIMFNADLAIGCINRMCVTKDKDEYFRLLYSLLSYVNYINTLRIDSLLLSDDDYI